MAQLAPPEVSAHIAVDDDDRHQRLRFRLWQLMLTMVTVLVTGWVLLLGQPLLSIITLAVAKHVLVAILMMGLHLYPVRARD